VTISTVGDKAQAFIPSSLPPAPPIEWSPGPERRALFHRLRQLGAQGPRAEFYKNFITDSQ